MQVDNLHVQVTDMEKLESLSKRLQEAEEMLKGVPGLKEKIESLEVSESILLRRLIYL